MVDSTKVIAEINKSDKIVQYCSILLNSISTIVHKFAGKIIKHLETLVCP